MERHCTNLPISILNIMADRCTSNDTFDKCVVCVCDIDSPSHIEPVEAYPSDYVPIDTQYQ